MTHNEAIRAHDSQPFSTPARDSSCVRHVSTTEQTEPGKSSHNMLNQLVNVACEIRYQGEELAEAPINQAPNGSWENSSGFESRNSQVETPASSPTTHNENNQTLHNALLTHTPSTPPRMPINFLTPPGTQSRGLDPQEGKDQRPGNQGMMLPSVYFDSIHKRSPSPPKRSYACLSDIQMTASEHSDKWHWAAGGTEYIKGDTPSKKRRLTGLTLKSEAEDVPQLKKSLGSIPQFVPPPPSLISPLRSTSR